jgi:hypothetical protein
MKEVAAMPAVKQIETVSEKLMELNPEFNGKVTDYEGTGTPKVENGVVTEFGFHTHAITDISPVRALQGLKSLKCSGGRPLGWGQLSDLSPLVGMTLTSLACNSNPVSDLSPLQAMPLMLLVCGATNVSDVTPLASCKSLIDLRIINATLIPASVAALQKTLPNCEINWDGPSVDASK